MSRKQVRGVLRARPRQQVHLGNKLGKNLLAYATAAAGAAVLSAALPAEAEIIYTPSNTPMASANQGPAFTPLDLDNDGKADFSFVMLSGRKYSSFGSSTGFEFFLELAPRQSGNGAVQGQQAPTAAAIPAGVKIGPQQKFGARDLYLHVSSFNNGVSRSSGTWINVEYAYVGVEFLINGQVHYGWARVKFPTQGFTADRYPSIYGYAYESTPNQPIVAGQTSGTAPETATTLAPATLGMLAAGAPGMAMRRAVLRSAFR